MIRTDSCPRCFLCQREGRWLYKELKDHVFKIEGSWNLKQCTDIECGLIWLDPMPITEDLEQAYCNYYTHHSISIAKKFQALTVAKQLYHKGKKFLKNRLVSLPGINRDRWLSDNLYLEGLKPGKLLDLGCGRGDFLQLMQSQGWQVEGVEFDRKAAAYATNHYHITVHTSNIFEINYASGTFEAIILNNVIEHLPNPAETLAECLRILKPNGKLILITPNSKSWGAKIFKQYWRGWEPPRHLFLFSPQNLASLALIAGFTQYQTFSSTRGIRGSSPILNASIQIKKQNSLLGKTSWLERGWLLALYEFLLTSGNSNLGEWAILIATK